MRPYHRESTQIHPNLEVKFDRARIVLEWGTIWEVRVLHVFSLFFHLFWNLLTVPYCSLLFRTVVFSTIPWCSLLFFIVHYYSFLFFSLLIPTNFCFALLFYIMPYCSLLFFYLLYWYTIFFILYSSILFNTIPYKVPTSHSRVSESRTLHTPHTHTHTGNTRITGTSHTHRHLTHTPAPHTHTGTSHTHYTYTGTYRDIQGTQGTQGTTSLSSHIHWTFV